MLLGKHHAIKYFIYNYINYHFYMLSATCVHVSAILHALASITSSLWPNPPSVVNVENDADTAVCPTSLLNSWKPPRKRKESTLMMSQVKFEKHVYGKKRQYDIPWVRFMYHHLKEIDWFPKSEQVAGILPNAFKEKYPTTYIIIDASELFIETPNNLTWSNYKQHNTTKFLIGIAPNGAIIFVSPIFVGSISDPELTRSSGLISKQPGKDNISVMADRGFTIQDQLWCCNHWRCLTHALQSIEVLSQLC